MSWFRSTKAKPDYTSLQIQTSTSTLPIPIVYGQNRVAPNLLWYANFRAAASGGGKGAGGKGSVFGGGSASSAHYTYAADVILGLCEGPIGGVGLIWKNLGIHVPLELGLGVENGTKTQATWSYLDALYPQNALAYQGTAYAWGAGYNLGETAAIGNHNFEIYGVLHGTGVNGTDADPAQVIYDFLTNAQYGAGFDPASIDATTLFGSSGDGSLQTYCKAMGYAFSPALISQEQASSVLTRWLQILSCAAVWSGGMLRFIPYGDTAIASGSQTSYQTQLSIPTTVPGSSTTSKPPSSVTVASPASFVSDGGVVFASSTAPLAFIGANFPSAPGAYGMITAGTYIFAAADAGKPIVITWTGATTTSYAPNLTPVFELTDLDFVDERGNTDPVQVERADIFSLPTIQRVEVLSRANQYSATPVEARDQSQIEIFGRRVGATITAHEICDENVMGPLVAQTILQRALYVRTKFRFRLSWEYCVLDPMDIVTITDAKLGLSNYPVRIIDIEEDDQGLLAITAEELVFGVSTPAFYPSASPAGAYQQNTGVPAVPVNTPLIVQPPLALTNGAAQIWVGASGVPGGTAAQWGGANVYVSTDGTTYSQIAVLAAPLRQGFLTAGLPIAAGWDSIHTLAIDLVESGGALSGTSAGAASSGATLSLVDGEFMAYESATLVADAAYNLTGLARGLGGSSPAAHSTGAPFARIDSAVLRYDLPTNLIGRTIWLKFQSFNVFGAGTEDLSTCTAFSVNLSTTAADPIAAQLASGFALDLGSVLTAPTLSDDFGQAAAAVTGAVDLGAAVPAPAHPVAMQLAAGNADLGAITVAITAWDDFGAATDPVAETLNLGVA